VIEDILTRLDALTPKAKILGNFIVQNPRRAVFMTTRELSEACQVSEATVVRFVDQLGYDGYGGFLQALRDIVDTELTLPDRIDLPGQAGPGYELLHQVLLEEMNNIKQIYETVDLRDLTSFVDQLADSPSAYIIGSRLSFTFAYYLGWSLTKVRKGIQIYKGSDKTTIDWLTIAPAQTLVVMFAVTRYPNELIHIARHTIRQAHTLILITDSSTCPLIQFAHQTIITPSRYIPFNGSPTTMCCLINYMIQELASQLGESMKDHQEQLEQAYLENDILFNMRRDSPETR